MIYFIIGFLIGWFVVNPLVRKSTGHYVNTRPKRTPIERPTGPAKNKN